MKNAGVRLAKLEQSAKRSASGLDWTQSPAYSAMSTADQTKLQAFAQRYSAEGFNNFADEELDEFERLIFPLAREEQQDAE